MSTNRPLEWYACQLVERDPFDPTEEGWHHVRICEHCGRLWYGLHCLCDRHQNPCPWCGIRPTPAARCPFEDELIALDALEMEARKG